MRKKLTTIFLALVAMLVPMVAWAQDEAKWGASKDALTGSGTLSAAFSAAKEEGSTVKYIQLQSDVNTVDKYNIDGGEFTLDLNDYTLFNNAQTLYIQKKGTKVTITDNSEEKRGRVVGYGEGCSAVTASSGANVTIEAGSYESEQYTVYIEGASSSATISGGTFTSSGSETIYNYGTLTILGGNFTSGTKCAVWLCDNSQTSIKGGTFNTTEGADGTIVYNGGKLDLSACPTTETEGTTAITDLSVYNNVENLAVSESDISLPDGYCFYDSENQAVGTLQNGKKYTIGTEAMWGASKDALTESGTLSDAYSAAKNGSVGYIQLQRDVTITSHAGNNIEGGEFTLDLNGHTLSSNVYTLYIRFSGTNVTITDYSEEKSGKVVSTGGGFSAVKASSGANVTIEAGSYESVYSTVYIEDAISSATISGGSFTSSGPIVFQNNGTLTISGGNFTSGTLCAVWVYDNSQTSITGGTFTTTEGAYGSIFYDGGKLDLSAYPTTETEGTTAITDLSVYNFVENLAVSGSTIALPAGYCFYDGDSNAVGTLKYYEKYTIGYNYELTVSSAGYATLCLPYDAVVPEGLTAYTATDAGEYIQLTKIESGKIAANEGVVIKGNTGTYYFAETTEEVTATEGNQLVGVTNETALTASDNAYMLTSDKNHENVAFRLLATDYTLAPYKAYLKVEENSARTLIPAMWDDNATGIETVNGSAQHNAIYNLAGQKLTRAQKGINIVGGKLVIK